MNTFWKHVYTPNIKTMLKKKMFETTEIQNINIKQFNQKIKIETIKFKDLDHNLYSHFHQLYQTKLPPNMSDYKSYVPIYMYLKLISFFRYKSNTIYKSFQIVYLLSFQIINLRFRHVLERKHQFLSRFQIEFFQETHFGGIFSCFQQTLFLKHFGDKKGTLERVFMQFRFLLFWNINNNF